MRLGAAYPVCAARFERRRGGEIGNEVVSTAYLTVLTRKVRIYRRALSEGAVSRQGCASGLPRLPQSDINGQRTTGNGQRTTDNGRVSLIGKPGRAIFDDVARLNDRHRPCHAPDDLPRTVL